MYVFCMEKFIVVFVLLAAIAFCLVMGRRLWARLFSSALILLTAALLAFHHTKTCSDKLSVSRYTPSIVSNTHSSKLCVATYNPYSIDNAILRLHACLSCPGPAPSVPDPTAMLSLITTNNPVTQEAQSQPLTKGQKFIKKTCDAHRKYRYFPRCHYGEEHDFRIKLHETIVEELLSEMPEVSLILEKRCYEVNPANNNLRTTNVTSILLRKIRDIEAAHK